MNTKLRFYKSVVFFSIAYLIIMAIALTYALCLVVMGNVIYTPIEFGIITVITAGVALAGQYSARVVYLESRGASNDKN